MAGHQLNIETNFLGKVETNFVMWSFFPTFLSIKHCAAGLEPAMSYLGRLGITAGITLGYTSAAGYTRQLMVGYDRVAANQAGVGTASRHADDRA